MALKTKELTVSGLRVVVTYKKMKNLIMRILPDGAIGVSAPNNTKDSGIIEFIEKNRKWIDTQLEKEAKQNSTKMKGDIQIYTYLLGKRYELCHANTDGFGVRIREDRIELCSPTMPSREETQHMLKEYKRAVFKQVLPQLTLECESIAGVHANEWRIRDMSTKWGSCNISDKRIWLTLLLINYPIPCIKSVMLHELTHLYESGHSKRFYQLLRGFVPDYDALEAELSMDKYKVT